MDIGCGDCTVIDTILTNINRDDVNHDIELKNLLSDDSNSSKNIIVVNDSNKNNNNNKNKPNNDGSRNNNDNNNVSNDNNSSNNNDNNNDNNCHRNKNISIDQLDFSMQIPNLRHIIGLEYNSDPLKIAKKNILQKIPDGNCGKLKSIRLWHASILDKNVAGVIRKNKENEEMREQEEMESKKEKDRKGSHDYNNDINDSNNNDNNNDSNNNSNNDSNNNSNNTSNSNSNNDSNNDNSNSNSKSNSIVNKVTKRKLCAISCIEVIEHLPSREDADLALKLILQKIQPDFGLFSTPNYESNKAIRMAVMDLPFNPISSLNNINEKKNENNNDEKDVLEEKEQYREADHKFEFTRQEFRDWAYNGLNSVIGEYEVSFTEVGACLPGMGGFYGGEILDENFNNKNEKINIKMNASDNNGNDIYNDSNNDRNVNNNKMYIAGYNDLDGSLKRGRERGCGGASQVAIFRRIKGEIAILINYF